MMATYVMIYRPATAITASLENRRSSQPLTPAHAAPSAPLPSARTVTSSFARPSETVGLLCPSQQHPLIGIRQPHTMRPHALRDRLTDTLINPMTLGHEKEPAKRQTDLTVNHVTPRQQSMCRPISR